MKPDFLGHYGWGRVVLIIGNVEKSVKYFNKFLKACVCYNINLTFFINQREKRIKRVQTFFVQKYKKSKKIVRNTKKKNEFLT